MGKHHVVNDTDPHLIGMLQFIRTNTSSPLYEYCRERLTPEEFKAIHANKAPNVYEYFYKRRVLGEFARTSSPPRKWPALTRGPRQAAADACFAAATITHSDWRQCVDRYKDDPRALIFLDPPYFNSFNQEYYGMDRVKTHADGRIMDGTALFLEMLEYLKTAAACVVIITNSCAIIDHIFAPFLKKRYAKTYSRSVKIAGAYVRKSTNHILLIGGGVSAAPELPPLTDEEFAALFTDLDI